jgi:Flp pilus assembly protein TadG
MRLLRLLRDNRGVSAMEFALILPILVMFSAGTIEYSRLILLTQKLQSGAFILADLTARDKELSTEQLGHIFLAIDQVIRPFAFADSGRAIVTSIGADEDDALILNWQCGGAGTFDAASELVVDGEVAALPGDITLAHGETLIAAEVFFDFEPLFGVGLGPRVIHRLAFYKPRLGELTELDDDCPDEA